MKLPRDLPRAAAAAFLATGFLTVALPKTLVHCGSLIDGTSDAPLKQMTVVVEGERIVSVEPGFTAGAPSDTVIDLSSATVMPGLIDCHVHLDMQLGPGFYAELVKLEPGDYALRAADNAKKTLLAGFTTVRNLGDNCGSTLALKRAIASGIAIGPRIYTAGQALGSTGGHADFTNGLSHRFAGEPGIEYGIINSADDARRAVRQHVKDGCDLIKIMATGGVLSLGDSAQSVQLSLEEMKAVVDTAHDYGLKVAVHAHGTEGMRRAVLAGVDSIEHGTYMTDEIIRLMKERGTYYVPTITAGQFTAAQANIPGFYPPSVAEKARRIGPLILGTFERAYQAGLKIAFGTDTGVSIHGENAQEFGYMVKGGMPPMKAIQCATLEASKLIGVEKDLGTVAPGKYADLAAVQGDPLADIGLMMRVCFVMKGGVVYKNLSGPRM